MVAAQVRRSWDSSLNSHQSVEDVGGLRQLSLDAGSHHEVREPLQNEGTAHAFLGVKRCNLRETHAKHGGGPYCKGLEKLLKGSWTLRIWLRVRMSRYDNPERGSIGDNIGDCYTWTPKRM